MRYLEISLKQLNTLLMIGLTLLLVGCATPKPSAESEFYLLSAPPLPHRPIDLNSALMVVGPITVADYLKRASIVTARSKNHYDISKLDQWGGDLEGEIQLTLVKHLLSLNPEKTYVQYSGLHNTQGAYNLSVDVLRFDATINGLARLEATWAWTDKHRKVVSAGLFSQSRDAGSSIEQSVSAQSELLKQLSQDVLKAL